MVPTSPTSDPSASEAPDIARLRLAVLRLARRIRQRADTGVTPSQLSALATLDRHGPLRLGGLAEHERVSKSTLTRSVAALEGAGLLERLPDPDDARCAVVAVTAEGAALLERSRQRADAYLARQFAALEAGERADLVAALPALESLIEAEA